VKAKKPGVDPALAKRVRDISEAVYRERLGQDGLEKMLRKDADDGAKLRERAGAYDALTRCYMRAMAPKRVRSVFDD